MTDNPWFKKYDQGVPSTLKPYPHKTILDYVRAHAKETPLHPAIIFKGSQLTYQQLDALSDTFAQSLIQLGIQKGDRVGLILPNCPQFLIAEFGIWKAGGIVVPLNPLYTDQELSRPLLQTGVETVVVLTSFYKHVKKIQPITHVKRVIATNIGEYFPSLTRILFKLFYERRAGHRIHLHADDYWLQDLLRKKKSVVPLPRILPDDPASILMSGGTTGTPKGVLGLHRCLVATGLQVQAWVEPLHLNRDDVAMLPLPLFHAYGFIGIQAPVFIKGHPLALIPNPRDLKDLLRSIREVKPAFFVAVPTLLNGLLNHPDVQSGKIDFSFIRLCFSAAAPLMLETRNRFEALIQGRIIEAYSLTEAMISPITTPAVGSIKEGAVGLPYPDIEVCIVDDDQGTQKYPCCKVGEILIRSPQLMTGYWNNPEETALILRDHGDGAPWLHTGDLGYLDEDGFLFIVDRKKDLIKTSGYQVWPREVEEVIATHPDVAEVGVTGVPHERKGEVVKAWVVPRLQAKLTEEAIRDYCRQQLAPYKIPAQVEFRKELPKSMVGKVLRRALKEEGQTKRD